MKQKLVGLALFVAAAAMPASLSRAADGDPAPPPSPPLPVVHDMGCAGLCASVVEPVGIDEPKPSYPGTLSGDYVEGLVELEYMIEPDGHVGDVMVTHLVGPQKFADITLNTVKSWVYKPATMNGQPVERDHTLVMRFDVKSVMGEVARADIVEAYDIARKQMAKGDLDGAQARLAKAQSEPKLNFYERAILANALAAIAIQHQDYLRAEQVLNSPVYLGASGAFDATTFRVILHTRLIADLGVGDISDALWALNRFRGMPNFDAADPLVQEVTAMKSKVDAADAFATRAGIPPAGDGDALTMGLYRKTFAIHNITGALDKVIIRCNQQTVESDITETATWHVPKDWNNCTLAIRGSAGTTFQLVQYAG